MHYTPTFTAAAATDISNGSVTVNSAWHEANGNLGTGSTSTPFVVDTVTPTVAVATNNTDVNLVNNTATATFTFSEAPTGFTAANITANGGTISNFTQVDATHYTATFTAAAATDISNGSVTVNSAWHEANGNLGTGSTSTPFVVDTVTPTVAVATNNTDVNLVNNTATATFTFSEAPTGFTAAVKVAV